MNGKELILWSVRMGLCCYAFFVVRVIKRQWSDDPANPESVNRDRLWWSLSGLLFWLHFVAAFHFQHQWSHQQAFIHTAQRTGQMLGWEFGYGLYFNYLFLLLWAMDLAWWWGSARTYRQRASWISVTMHAYLVFVMVNGAIVFVNGPTRWVSILVLCLAGILLTGRLLGKTESGPAC